tara:strand:- start:1806 stop:3818 length:2013 start_codon:yes stop_codon:yes gene_type:complete
MAPARRFLSTVVSASDPSGDGIYQNTTGKPLSVSLGAQAISTDKSACMTVAVGLGTTSFTSRLGIASGNFERYFGLMADGSNPIGFTTVHGTFYLGQDCNCPGGSYCSSPGGIASFIAADGTETKNWEAGLNPWGCCICICGGPFPDGSCSSWCANTFWGGQEQINFALSFYNEYTGKCWSEEKPYADAANIISCQSTNPLGWTRAGTCWYGPCRQHPPHAWLVHGCHASTPCEAGQVWVNPYCCCGKCNWEGSSPSSMNISCQYNDQQCGSYFNWYALTNNQPTVVQKYFCCDGSCNYCRQECGNCFGCYTAKCPDYHLPGDIEVYLGYIARGTYRYCNCFCCQCGRWCRGRTDCCCISQFTDCYSWLCCMCCFQHMSNGWVCNHQGCPMNPLGGVAGAATQCAIVRHHKTFVDCQMWFIGNMNSCTWWCNRCSCELKILDLWVKPPKYGSTGCCTNEYSIKYLSWNPQKCCTYLLIRSANEAQCGVFSWFGSGQDNEYREWQLNSGSITCIWPCDSTYFTKVAPFPVGMTSEKYVTPMMCTTCIHRVEKCLWAMGVYDCDAKMFDPFVSTDLINWSPAPSGNSVSESVVCSSPENCIVEFLSTTCKWRTCTSFDAAVCKEGILDYKLAFNNYERTGVILDCNERIFINNIQSTGFGTSFNFQVWGYEG